jgi:hypothetical protein
VVLVDHAEDPSPPYRSVDRDDDAGIVVRWALSEALVWTMPIEVCRILVEDPAGVALIVDQHPVRALVPDAADEPLRIAVRPRCTRRDLSMWNKSTASSPDA